MKELEDLKLSRNMKYEALYWALGFLSHDGSVFKKKINDFEIIIDSDNQTVKFDSRLTIVNGSVLSLTTHKSFVILECINRLLEMGYGPSEIILDLNNEYDLYLKNIYIKCFEWKHIQKDEVKYNKNHIISVCYSSRLVSGILERDTIIRDIDGEVHRNGLFECEKMAKYNFYNPVETHSDDFIISGTKLLKYIGNETKVDIPEGITELASCLFWDNQKIEEVHLPESLISLGGDTFYNCYNLKSINIPKNVRFVGNNPFAGCPFLTIRNSSNFLKYENGALFNADKTRLIYYAINQKKY